MAATLRTIKAKPLTREGFASFGDVIEAAAGYQESMNSTRFERFQDLADVDVGAADGGRPALSIARCRIATRFPHDVTMLERHALGSQAFVPLSDFRFIVVVAPSGALDSNSEIAAFISNGRQGVNYHKGTWHMPMVALAADQEFLIIDRAGVGLNCEEQILAEPLRVEI